MEGTNVNSDVFTASVLVGSVSLCLKVIWYAFALPYAL